MALTGSISFGFLCLVAVTLYMVACTSAISSAEVNCALYMSETCAQMCLPKCPSKTKKLYIQGFVPGTNDDFRSETIIPAAFAAIDEVNSDCSILPKYELVVEFVNTKCDPSEATWQLINSIVLQDSKLNISKIMFLGGGCSLATEPLAALAGRFYKIPMLSYGASSPALSDDNMFPKFFRTLPSETQANSARLAIMKFYDWKRVATLHETKAIFSSTVDNFHVQFDNFFDVNPNTTDHTDRELILRSFTDNPTIPLQQIKDGDIRIILGYYYEDQAVKTLCEAYNMGLTGENYLWMYIAWYAADWWVNGTDVHPDCTKENLREAVRNSFFFDSYNLASDPDQETDTISRTLKDFNKKYDCFLEEFFTNPQTSNFTLDRARHPYYTYTYDAVWTIAKALQETELELQKRNDNLTLGDYKHLDNATQIIPDILTDFITKTNFTGVSGQVLFDSNGDRINLNVVYQLVDDGSNSGNLVLKPVVIHYPYLPFNDSKILTKNYDLPNSSFSMEPVFQGGSAPLDRSRPVRMYIRPALIYVSDLFITVAIIVAFALLIFNLITYRKPLIRDSAPFINVIVICGCIVILATSYLLGVDSQTPNVNATMSMLVSNVSANSTDAEAVADLRYGIICNVRVWFFTIGFTLSFGALFAKTWQVYRVYTNQSLKKQDFQMWRFFLILGIFLVIDVVYLSIWTGVFRLQRTITNKTVSNTLEIYESCFCENFGYLVGALYVYKGLIVVFGLFLAYESRNVKYRFINDSRFVSIAMYIVVILIGIGAPLSLVLAVNQFVDATYGLAIFMVVASCLSCLLITHIPKFVYMAKGLDTMVQENNKEEITESSGLQLGTATVLDATVKSTEDEVADLRIKNTQRDIELNVIKGNGVELDASFKPRNGSDNDSGVLVTGDDTEIFSSENDEQRLSTVTPPTGVTPGTTL